MEISNKNLVLAPKYYHENFNYLLSFVDDKYKEILNENERLFLEKYHQLSEDEQCLFIRFCNRKGNLFNEKTLKYPEINSIPDCLENLRKNKFIIEFGDEHVGFVSELLSFLKKEEVLKIFEEPLLKSAKKLSKSDLISLVLETYTHQKITTFFANETPILKVNFEIETAFIKYLFFGNRYSDMSEFVMRDLGIMQYEKIEEDQFIARFTTRLEAEDRWQVSIYRESFEELKEFEQPKEVFNWFMTILENTKNISEIALPSLEKLKIRVATFLEKNKEYDKALQIFNLATCPPSRERVVRILIKKNLIPEAIAAAELILENPKNADEHFFATDNLNKLKLKITKSRKSTTEKLDTANEISISMGYKYRVELGTMHYFMAEGYHTAFTENHLWRALFGLVFWDIIFDPSLVAFHHPLQKRPSDLYLPDFFEKKQTYILAQLNQFETAIDLINFVANKYNEKLNITNPFVVWLDEIWDLVRVLIEKIELSKLKIVLTEMAKNLNENTRGFPDLMIWKGNELEFIEVKSPTDSLSNQQLYWLHFFEKVGIKSSVLRVNYDASIPLPVEISQ